MSFLPVQLESADWTYECQGLTKDWKEVARLENVSSRAHLVSWTHREGMGHLRELMQIVDAAPHSQCSGVLLPLLRVWNMASACYFLRDPLSSSRCATVSH